jgi:hypothetical protein
MLEQCSKHKRDVVDWVDFWWIIVDVKSAIHLIAVTVRTSFGLHTSRWCGCGGGRYWGV